MSVRNGTITSGPDPHQLDWQLCFIDDNVWAYFANVPPTEMGGDDWDDSPHDCNASEPYPRDGQEVVCVAFEGPFEMGGMQGSGSRIYGYSADELNRCQAPWLYDPGYGDTYPEPKDTILAGVTLREFIARMQAAGGTVYVAVPSDERKAATE